MEKLEEIKGMLLEEIYEDAIDLLDIYSYSRFDYLGISRGSWEKLFVKIAERMIKENVSSKDFAGELCRNFNISVRNYISKRLKAGDLKIGNNLLLKLQRNYRNDLVLRNFVYEFEQLGISFMDEVYDLMKEKSSSFRAILERLGLLDSPKDIVASYLKKKYQIDLKYDFGGKNKKSKLEASSSKPASINTLREDSPKIEGKKNSIEIAVHEVKSDFRDKKNGPSLTNTLIIDYDLMRKYSNFTLEEIKEMYGERFHNLPSDSVQLLERSFSIPTSDYCFSPYDAEKEINLLLYDYKRKSTEISLDILIKVYLENKDKFKEEEALYLECFIFNLQEEAIFAEKFPNGSGCERSTLINKLEMLYYGIEDIFDYTLTKEQYLSVLAKYPNEIEKSIKDILDDFYGINNVALSIQEISKKYSISYDEAKDLLRKARKYCLSLYSNLSNSQKADASIYMPYVLDERYNLNDETRKALALYFEGISYEEIEKIIGKKGVSNIISKGIQKLDAYRFGVEKVKGIVEDSEVEVTDEDILLEIERHPSESVITIEEKTFLSYYLGIKNKYNPEKEQLSGKKLQERLNFKRNVPARYRDILSKIKQRKIDNLEPEFIIIPREKLSEILMDPHLPITSEDRIIICSLLEINGYPLKTLLELAQELDVSDKSIRRKYQIAIINIQKYLIGEKEGTVNYSVDIVPNLKYFPSKERELIQDYYEGNLTNKEIAKKYNLPIGKVTRLMYRIKTTLNEYIHNPNAVKFDYEYYQMAVDCPDFPFRGDLEQAKKIFALYVGEHSFGRMDIQEIKEKLQLTMQPITITRIINNLVLSTFKYRDGIKKENTFTVNDVQEYYQSHKGRLNEKELQLIETFFDKSFGKDMRMSEDLTYLLLKDKHPEYFRIGSSKTDAIELLKKYYNRLSKKIINLFMVYANITERDLMSEEEKVLVFMLISDLDSMLKEQPSQK